MGGGNEITLDGWSNISTPPPSSPAPSTAHQRVRVGAGGGLHLRSDEARGARGAGEEGQQHDGGRTVAR
eukprot:4650273-Pyramimonas_sp.AAC.1